MHQIDGKRVLASRVTTRRVISVQAEKLPATVADTKAKFLKNYKLPVPGLFSTQLQEFLVEAHFTKTNVNFMYTEISSLGFVSLFNQVVSKGFGIDTEKLFTAFCLAVDDDPSKIKDDAAAIQAWAEELGSPEELKADSDGGRFPKLLAEIKERSADDKFNTTLFFSIGLFRLLELTGAKDPKALASLVKELGANQGCVNRQLTSYKAVLKKLQAAKELMAEFLEREKRKQAERDASKAEAKADTPEPPKAEKVEEAPEASKTETSV